MPRTASRSELFVVYKDLPSHRTVLDREGRATVADAALIGDEERVGEQLADLADAGVTRLRGGRVRLAGGARPHDGAAQQRPLAG